MNFTPYLWQPSSWPILWFFALTARSTFSICKVVLCRLPRTQRSNYQASGYGSTNNTAGTAENTAFAYPSQQGTFTRKDDPRIEHKLTKTDEDSSAGFGSFTGGSFSSGTGDRNKPRTRPPAKLTIESEAELDNFI